MSLSPKPHCLLRQSHVRLLLEAFHYITGTYEGVSRSFRTESITK